jgi:hypothetical protein
MILTEANGYVSVQKRQLGHGDQPFVSAKCLR